MQNNERKIQPIPFYTPEMGLVQADIFRLYNSRDYDFNGSGMKVDFVLGKYDNDTFIPLINCSCDVPAEIVNGWVSDQPIFDYVMQQKNYK